MSNQNITRRSVMQGAGAVGLAGIVGGTVVAQEDTETGQPEDESAAVRVVHAVADAPAVTVRLSSDDAMTDDGDGGTVTGDGATTEDDGNATGDETVTDADEGEPALQISALEYSGVTNYNEVEPGTYQLELVVSNENIVDQIIGIFGDDDSDDETVLYQETVEVEESTTYTAVAFGELSEGPSQTGGVDDGVGMGDEETEDDGIGVGGNETEDDGVGMDDEETEAGGVDDSGQEMVDRSLRVAVLEDDLSAPEEGMARFRLFHAIPDAPSVSVARIGAGTDVTTTGEGMGGTESGDGVGGTETPDGAPATDGGQTETDGTAGSQTVLVEELAYGETETIEVEAGDYSFQITPTGSQAGDGLGEDGADDGGVGDDSGGNETDEDGLGEDAAGTETASQEAVTQQDTSAEVDVTLEDSVATSGFAIGYFDPEAAADERSADGDDGAGVGENDTDGGLGAGENDSEDGLGDGQNDTGDGLGDDQNETEAGDGEQMPQADGIQDRSVELVTVFDSRDGERAAGGNRDLL